MTEYITRPADLPPDVKYAHALGRGRLLDVQIMELVKPINPAYAGKKEGKTFISQHQARAEMNRIFGYGNWDHETTEAMLGYEEFKPTGKDQKERWVVGYRAKVTVNVRDLWGMPIATMADYHFEENAPQPNRGEAHALALTSVESYALRRALIDLGDRFGLGLYNGGSTAPHGQYTIQLQPGVMFNWVPREQAQQAPQPQSIAPVAQPSHETIQAEPWAGDDEADFVAADQYTSDGDGTNPPPAAAPRQRAPRTTKTGPGSDFKNAQEQIQASNAAARLQGGLKQDDQQAPPPQNQAPNPYLDPNFQGGQNG